jgi:hypothetical protein
MLAGGTDGLYRDALAAPHRMSARVEVWDGFAADSVLLQDLPFLSGSVTATLNSRVTRTLTFTVDESFYPVLPSDDLAPYGNVIKAFAGIELGDGSTAYEWPVFVGRIQKTTLDSAGIVQVDASDLGAEVVAFEFEIPENSSAGVLIPTEVRRLISDALADATFGTFDVYADVVQPLTWEQDRAAALDEMTVAVGSFWYSLANGKFVMRRYPWTVSAAPVVTLADGDGGIVTRYAVSRSREGVFNSVSVTGERLNGDAPVFAVARDTTPGSPTLYKGHFGVRVQTIRLQTPSSQGMAQTAANDALRREIALVEAWEWEQIPDAAMELGDVLQLDVAGRNDVIQVVDSFTLPLGPDGAMAVTGRSLIVPALGLSG